MTQPLASEIEQGQVEHIAKVLEIKARVQATAEERRQWVAGGSRLMKA